MAIRGATRRRGLWTINYALPAGLTEGNTFARVRLSSTGGLSPTGFALDGEVEDYQIPILSKELWHLAGQIISAAGWLRDQTLRETPAAF